MLLKRISKWFSKYKNSFFLYKDGFFELPHLTNSPEAIVRSVIKMPFVKHSQKRQFIKTNSPFMKGEMFYEEIEEGLWIILGDLFYKANVNYKRVIDNKLPSDYYFLSLNVLSLSHKSALINDISYKNSSWLLFKPKAWAASCKFKGTKELTITYFFNEKWLKKELISKELFEKSQVRQFFDSQAKYIILPDEKTVDKPHYEYVVENFRNTQERSLQDKTKLKGLAYKMIFRFVEIYKTQNIYPKLFEIPDGDRKTVHKIEKILLESLMEGFPGIESISKNVGVSETKIKTDFKTAFGKTMFQYFRQKQMDYAHSLIQNKTNTIKEIASQLGYENPSKFSAAFKNQYGYLPSEL